MRLSVFASSNRLDEIAQKRLGATLSVHFSDRAFERVARELLDHGALRRNHERGLVRHDRYARRQHRDDYEKYYEQHDQVQTLRSPSRKRQRNEKNVATYFIGVSVRDSSRI